MSAEISEKSYPAVIARRYKSSFETASKALRQPAEVIT
jgi:hypothetical protein